MPRQLSLQNSFEMGITKVELLHLADTRIDDAKALLDSGRPDGAYYLAGYAVELGLKAVIASQIKAEEVPDRNIRDFWSHDFSKLIKVAGIQEKLQDRLRASYDDVFPDFEICWEIANEWSEASRYTLVGSIQANRAKNLIDAITWPKTGVLIWLKSIC